MSAKDTLNRDVRGADVSAIFYHPPRTIIIIDIKSIKNKYGFNPITTEREDDGSIEFVSFTRFNSIIPKVYAGSMFF